jgi:2-oxoglutarate ferredoxin oxidoreductase subunit beta
MMTETGSKKVLCELPKSRLPVESPLCPGCQHGVIGRILSEVIDDLGIQGDTICIAGVGCHAMMLFTTNVDFVQALHGRAPSIGTGVKRGLNGKKIVFTVQGDGDLASIGMGDMIHAAIRGEELTIIFCNNSVYGTTGGQMAPTTLVGQPTATTPNGRQYETAGFPFPGVAYSARCAVNSLGEYAKTKNALKTAFQKQIDGVGFSIVEILSACPPALKRNPVKAVQWIQEHMMAEFPLGEFKNVDEIRPAYTLKGS